MLSTRSPIPEIPKFGPKSHRKPLQPKNIYARPKDLVPENWAKPKPLEISWNGESDKENHPISATTTTTIESIDASLAEELVVVRRKLERLRSEKEETEKLLRERDLILENAIKELLERGKVQTMVEIQVDKFIRLKELKSSCMKIPPFRSLRAKEREKKMTVAQLLQGVKDEEKEIMEDTAQIISSEQITEN